MQNRTRWMGDNLAIMRGMNAESIDPLYLDLTFNSDRNTYPRLRRRSLG